LICIRGSRSILRLSAVLAVCYKICGICVRGNRERKTPVFAHLPQLGPTHVQRYCHLLQHIHESQTMAGYSPTAPPPKPLAYTTLCLQLHLSAPDFLQLRKVERLIHVSAQPVHLIATRLDLLHINAFLLKEMLLVLIRACRVHLLRQA